MSSIADGVAEGFLVTGVVLLGGVVDETGSVSFVAILVTTALVTTAGIDESVSSTGVAKASTQAAQRTMSTDE
jgi:ssDNA-binding replication factor A large subunit